MATSSAKARRGKYYLLLNVLVSQLVSQCVCVCVCCFGLTVRDEVLFVHVVTAWLPWLPWLPWLAAWLPWLTWLAAWLPWTPWMRPNRAVRIHPFKIRTCFNRTPNLPDAYFANWA